MKKIAIFASGNGTNAQAIIDYFHQKNKPQTVAIVITNNPKAHIIQRAHNAAIPCLCIKNRELANEKHIEFLRTLDVKLIVLAGYLARVPEKLITAFEGKIINLHPALLPKYGGKGMYGMKVHEQVIGNREENSGITIHWVNESYDEGEIVLQTTCPVLANDTPEKLAKRIQQLEHKHLPLIVEKLLDEMEEG